MKTDPQTQEQIRTTLEADTGKTVAALRQQQQDTLTRFVQATLDRQMSTAKPSVEVTRTTTQVPSNTMPLQPVSVQGVPPAAISSNGSPIAVRAATVSGGIVTSTTLNVLTQ